MEVKGLIKGLTSSPEGLKIITTADLHPTIKDPVKNLQKILEKQQRCPMLEEKVFFSVGIKMTLKEMISFKYVRNSIYRMTENCTCLSRYLDDDDERWTCIVQVSVAEAIATIYELTQPIMRKEIPSIITSIEKVANEFIRLTTPKGEDFNTAGLDKDTDFDAEAFARDIEKQNIQKCLSTGLHTNFVDMLVSESSENSNPSEIMKTLISFHPDCVLCEKVTEAVSRLLIPCELMDSQDAPKQNDDLFIFLSQDETNIMDIHIFDDNEEYRVYQIDVYHAPASQYIKSTYKKTSDFAVSKLNNE
jgi:hypothetical protein